mgnify:CR=1 FL=1
MSSVTITAIPFPMFVDMVDRSGWTDEQCRLLVTAYRQQIHIERNAARYAEYVDWRYGFSFSRLWLYPTSFRENIDISNDTDF